MLFLTDVYLCLNKLKKISFEHFNNLEVYYRRKDNNLWYTNLWLQGSCHLLLSKTFPIESLEPSEEKKCKTLFQRTVQCRIVRRKKGVRWCCIVTKFRNRQEQNAMKIRCFEQNSQSHSLNSLKIIVQVLLKDGQ